MRILSIAEVGWRVKGGDECEGLGPRSHSQSSEKSDFSEGRKQLSTISGQGELFAMSSTGEAP